MFLFLLTNIKCTMRFVEACDPLRRLFPSGKCALASDCLVRVLVAERREKNLQVNSSFIWNYAHVRDRYTQFDNGLYSCTVDFDFNCTVWLKAYFFLSLCCKPTSLLRLSKAFPFLVPTFFPICCYSFQVSYTCLDFRFCFGAQIYLTLANRWGFFEFVNKLKASHRRLEQLSYALERR